ncbi:MAG: glutamate--cysteine ligase [Gammaproteobacteria bacterium RIFCSPHIGHO2_12_FULL_43_28]|nr:MAG: glutamate--cysteine ligase [Gammaproteobacteria bacterium RIFCSPHIGHO2_12_FULL_43_28]
MADLRLVLPALNTEYIEPFYTLERTLLAEWHVIHQWFATQWRLTPPPVYGSVDLRNAGFKVAPIDMNLFPAGFNNLNPTFLSVSAAGAKKSIHETKPDAKNILIITESHTRNLFYWDNVKAIINTLQAAGFTVCVSRLDLAPHTSTDITLRSGEIIRVEGLIREANALIAGHFKPDYILLNNDLSEGIPAILHDVDVPLMPPAELGWSKRFKSEHFQFYAEVAADFAKEVKLDPWLIAPLFRYCGELNFMQQEGMDCLVANAEILFAEIEAKYAEYQLPYKPFLVVKADTGTYGMAVMTVRSIDELKSLNRKQRTRMATTKSGQPVRRVIIQEGVHTFEVVGSKRSVAEPVVYLWGNCVAGGFYRVHQERGIDENLNAPGMHFEPLAFPNCCDSPHEELGLDDSQNRLFVYGVIARLSMLAAAREVHHLVTEKMKTAPLK